MLHTRSIVHLTQVSLQMDPVWLEPSCLGSTVDPARVSLGHVVLQYRNLWVMLHTRFIVHLTQVSLQMDPVWLEPSCLESTVDPARVSLGSVGHRIFAAFSHCELFQNQHWSCRLL